jgi:hypothetical protein
MVVWVQQTVVQSHQFVAYLQQFTALRKMIEAPAHRNVTTREVTKSIAWSEFLVVPDGLDFAATEAWYSV